MEPNPLLVLSSFTYILPAIVCYTLAYNYLCLMYITVVLVSACYHASKHPMILWVDIPLSHINHVATLLNILKGGWLSMPAYFAWLLYALITYYYGYRTSSLIWDPDRKRATPWHAGLHILTSLVSAYTIYVSS
jgi:hypothetical protein